MTSIRSIALPLAAAILLCLLVACTPASTTGSGAATNANDPAQAVQQYLQAKVAGDKATLRNLLCAPLEASLENEAVAFSTNKATLDAVACTFDGKSSVSCTGSVIFDYGGEKQKFPLATYGVVQESGVWKWCGEK